jgi:hypothetical protein
VAEAKPKRSRKTSSANADVPKAVSKHQQLGESDVTRRIRDNVVRELTSPDEDEPASTVPRVDAEAKAD